MAHRDVFSFSSSVNFRASRRCEKSRRYETGRRNLPWLQVGRAATHALRAICGCLTLHSARCTAAAATTCTCLYVHAASGAGCDVYIYTWRTTWFVTAWCCTDAAEAHEPLPRPLPSLFLTEQSRLPAPFVLPSPYREKGGIFPVILSLSVRSYMRVHFVSCLLFRRAHSQGYKRLRFSSDISVI